MKSTTTSQDEHFIPLHMNGLQGRMLCMPSKSVQNKNEILVIYGQKTNLEQWLELSKFLSKYGNVTVPDLPGFGGMQSFHKIGQKPSLDNLADYLAAFIKLRYKRKRLTIIGVSFGFVVVTRMLQNYPELARKVNYLFSVNSLAHHDDLKLSRTEKVILGVSTRIFKSYLFATLYKDLVLKSPLYNTVFQNIKVGKNKLKLIKVGLREDYLLLDLELKKQNDTRTYMTTMHELLSLDNCVQRINLPVWDITGIPANYIDKSLVEQHLRIIYKDYHEIKLEAKNKKSIMGSWLSKDIKSFIPRTAKELLSEIPA